LGQKPIIESSMRAKEQGKRTIQRQEGKGIRLLIEIVIGADLRVADDYCKEMDKTRLSVALRSEVGCSAKGKKWPFSGVW